MKKSQLRQLVIEELKKAFNETKTVKGFDEVIDFNKDAGNSLIDWTVVSTKKWDKNRAEEFQDKQGYSTNAYGFFKFKEQKTGDKFQYTWQSYTSSD